MTDKTVEYIDITPTWSGPVRRGAQRSEQVNLTPYLIKRDVREYITDAGDIAIARRTDRHGTWLVTATANDAALTQVQGTAHNNDAGFRGRQWESSIDGQQHPTLVSVMREAVYAARSDARFKEWLAAHRKEA